MMLAGGEADIAFLSTGAYLSYHGIEPLDLVAVPQMEGQTSYKTYLVVPADSEAVSIKGLKGGTFAFTDPQSNSGRMAVDEILRAENVTPEQFFKRYFYTYNHDKSLLAVANHLADGAAVDSFIYDFFVQASTGTHQPSKDYRYTGGISSRTSSHAGRYATG